MVKGFFARTQLQKSVVEIIHYCRYDKFIVKIKLKDLNDELIIAKGFDQNSPIDVMNALKMEDTTQSTNLEANDAFGMPELHFNYDHVFKDLLNKRFDNLKLNKYEIKEFYEKVKFDLGYSGVRLENETAWGMVTGMPPKINKRLILNKPFWLVMKRKKSKNPYFILGVNNSKVMDLSTAGIPKE